MNVKVVVLLTVIMFLLTPIGAVTAPDTYDSILVAYRLTPAQESTFSRTDGVESPFWALLQNSNADKLHLIPSRNTRSGSVFISENDAQATFYAAWGTKGLYLLVDVIDDWWSRCLPNESCGSGDGVSFFLDENSSSYMLSNLSVFYFLELTKSMVQYALTCENDPIPCCFRFNKIDSSWDPNSTSYDTAIKYSGFLFSDGESLGIFVEPLYTLNSSIRKQEWLIPWRHFSYSGISMPFIGQRAAAVFEYNDEDNAMDGGINSLCWDTSGSPYSNNPHVWHDIEFGPYLSDVGIRSLRQTLPTQHSASIIKTEYFALDGRKIQPIRNQAFVTKKRVAVVRTVDTHGVARFEQRLIDQ